MSMRKNDSRPVKSFAAEIRLHSHKIMRDCLGASLMLAVLVTSGCSNLGTQPVAQEKEIDIVATGHPGANAQVLAVKASRNAQEMQKIRMLVTQGKEEQAERELRDLKQRDPSRVDAHLNLGLILARTGRHEQAMQEYRHVLDLDPDNAVAHNQSGILHRGNRNLAAAEAAYLKAIESAPDYALPHLNLAILYDIYMRKKTLALEHYRRFQRLTHRDDALMKSWISDLEQQIRDGDMTP